jgi:hypothetical protein
VGLTCLRYRHAHQKGQGVLVYHHHRSSLAGLSRYGIEVPATTIAVLRGVQYSPKPLIVAKAGSGLIAPSMFPRTCDILDDATNTELSMIVVDLTIHQEKDGHEDDKQAQDTSHGCVEGGYLDQQHSCLRIGKLYWAASTCETIFRDLADVVVSGGFAR